MGKKLVVVESPAKARTIGPYLGGEFEVKSSYGHIRDLPKKGMSVDIARDFEPTYEIHPDKTKVVRELKAALKTADSLWLATDEDREGEAIAWHLCHALGVKPEETKRIVFHEITKGAIAEAVTRPRTIDQHMVDAQQARRILDRLVGYELSPVLWKKIQTGLSAGRVQSVAVRLIVDREREIENFKPASNFKITAEFKADNQPLSAELEIALATEADARSFLEDVKAANFKIADLATRPAAKNPPLPLTTSTLQQTASRLLGFSVKQTMVVAQQLYEAGHITYMRTDSLNLAQSALDQAAQVIKQRFGDNYYQHRTFKTKSRLAQEAHEAIRPTDLAKGQIEGDKGQTRLYELIWKRTLATQMKPAAIERTEVKIANSARPELFLAKGEVLKFKGFLKAYDLEFKADDTLLPPLKSGQALGLSKMIATQTLSRPKPRYTEASLVKKLEALGIGRPSTYAPTISTIQDRGYVTGGDLEGESKPITVLELADGQIRREAQSLLAGSARNKLHPTQTGEVVTDFLVKHFPDIVDYQFTAKVEEDFDQIAQGRANWRAMLKSFYERFHPTVTKSEGVSRQEAMKMRKLGDDPSTGKPIFARLARYGPIVQMGEVEDDDKPKFAPLPSGLKIGAVTLADALKLLSLPRVVGKTESGEEIVANIGPYGPYIKGGGVSVSIKDGDPFAIEEAEARQLMADKQERQTQRVIQDFKNSKIQILNGRYGPYISDSTKNAPIPKDQDPTKLSLAEAEKLLAAAKPGRRSRSRRR